MRKIRIYIFPLFLFLFLLIALIGKTHYASAALPKKNILVLHQYSEDYPYHMEFNEGLREALDKEKGYIFDYYFEYFKMDKLPDDEIYIESIVEQFKIKRELSNWTPDVVITSGGFSEFMQKYRGELFADIPVISIPRRYEVDTEKSSPIFNKDIILQSKEDYGKNIDLILRIQSKIKKIYIVIGNSNNEKNIIMDIKISAKPYSNIVEFIYLNQFSYSEMLDTLRNISDDSAILFVRWLMDAEGESFIPTRVLKDIIQEEKVPIYGTQKQFLGEGILGGYMYSISSISEDAAKAVVEIIEGNPGEFVSGETKYNEYVFDGRVLEKWDVDSKMLPPDSIIEYNEPGVWATYGIYMIVGLLVMILEMFLIIALVINFQKRKKAKKELQIMNESLEAQVDQRTSELQNAKERLEEVNRKLEFISIIDPLTKLYNRNHMNERLHQAKQAFIRTGQLFTVMMVDIDNFKQINDKFGHAAGDQVLKMVSNCLKLNFREYDVVSRWGGEEFLILCPMLDKEDGQERAELIRKKVEEAKCAYKNKNLSVTVTIGAAAISEDETVDGLIYRADKALYRGKSEGKNKVVFR